MLSTPSPLGGLECPVRVNLALEAGHERCSRWCGVRSRISDSCMKQVRCHPCLENPPLVLSCISYRNVPGQSSPFKNCLAVFSADLRCG